MSRVVVFGAGFLGARLARGIPGARLVRADICDREGVARALAEAQADAAINAAGKTGRPNVDWCESHPHETFRANVTGALTLAEACSEAGIYLLHLGSGCIFCGPSPDPAGWREDDFANPRSLYARSKYAADLALSRLPSVAIVRLRMPIDGAPHDRNLITRLTRYREVADVENSVTVVDDLVGVARGLIERRAAGIFHATNPGAVRHRRILELYRELVDPRHRCALIPEQELVTRGLVRIPRSNCILASARLAAVGITMRPIEEALGDVMRRYAGAVH
jgi:dTDP-4-dehydrorhamnose reductase